MRRRRHRITRIKLHDPWLRGCAYGIMRRLVLISFPTDSTDAADDFGRLPAGAELHQYRQFLAPPGLAHRQLVAGFLPAHRPRAGGRKISLRLLRRPPVDAGHVRAQSRPHRCARHPLREARCRHRAYRHGHGDAAPWARRHLFDQLLRAISRGAPVRHARSDDAWARGLERRHLAQRRRSAEHGPRRGFGPRPALRPRRRVHGDRAWALGYLGGRFHRPGQGGGLVRQAGKSSSPRLPGPLLPFARAVHCAALGAGPSGHHPGRSERPRPALRRAMGRGDLRRLSERRDRPARLRGSSRRTWRAAAASRRRCT